MEEEVTDHVQVEIRVERARFQLNTKSFVPLCPGKDQAVSKKS